MSSIKRININPNDIQKISKELILYITLKDGTILVSDNNIPSQDINQLINNKEENILHSNKKNSAIFNYKNKININNSYNKNILSNKNIKNPINSLKTKRLTKKKKYYQPTKVIILILI